MCVSVFMVNFFSYWDKVKKINDNILMQTTVCNSILNENLTFSENENRNYRDLC